LGFPKNDPICGTRSACQQLKRFSGLALDQSAATLAASGAPDQPNDLQDDYGSICGFPSRREDVIGNAVA
jgi:hypothetical protein